MDHTPAWVALGVGGLGALVGSVSGALAFAQKDDVANACPSEASCESKRRAGNRAADVATAGFIVAGVGAAVGAILILAATGKPTRRTGTARPSEHSARVVVGWASLGVEGQF